jgi:hypothetical protein
MLEMGNGRRDTIDSAFRQDLHLPNLPSNVIGHALTIFGNPHHPSGETPLFKQPNGSESLAFDTWSITTMKPSTSWDNPGLRSARK